MNWQGSVLAPETGEYEFVVRSENAMRLWVNDNNKPLIDISVKSGSDTEYRETIYLLGGRVYPLRLELSQGQGEDVVVELLWKVPRRSLEVIPQRSLSPADAPEVFVARTPFPPDDRSVGYERGTSISKAWDQATTDAAHRDGRLRRRPPQGPGRDRRRRPMDKDREKRLREFCSQFAERAFRRPLADEQRALYIDRQFQEGGDPKTAVKKVVLLVLKSPRFLYREIGTGAPDAVRRGVAALVRALGLDPRPAAAGTPPPPAGWPAASRSPSRPAAWPRDLRARSKLREFLLQWLRVDQVPEIAKDPKALPRLRRGGRLRPARLARAVPRRRHHGPVRRLPRAAAARSPSISTAGWPGSTASDLPPDAPFQKVDRAPGERSGILTHPYLMANFAYTASSSPIHRGVFLSRSVLGRPLRPPPEAVAPLAADLHPDLTTRQRVELADQARIVPVLPRHDQPPGISRWSTTTPSADTGIEEKDRPVDATGSYETRTGDRVTFDGAGELAAFLASSQETHNAFVQQLFHYLVKQPIRAFGRKELTDLRGAFAAGGYNIRELMVEIMTSSALAAASEEVETVATGRANPRS